MPGERGRESWEDDALHDASAPSVGATDGASDGFSGGCDVFMQLAAWN